MMAGTGLDDARRDYEACLRVMLDETRERYVAYRGQRLAGFSF
jgi:hypothetical protein